MGKSLVIVESPAKAKTINKYLGSEYQVRSCVGHIRDLPKGGKGKRTTEPLPKVPATAQKYAKLIRSMGINPYKGWQAKYEILPGKEKVIGELKTLARAADDIYLATDLDREGEAIAWNLTEILGKKKNYKRVIFTEITKDAITQAFANPLELDENKVQAQQARRYLDRVVGYMLSPLLWKKIARGLSAGRVQSVAVKLVTEREIEIRHFVPEEFWTLDVLLRNAAGDELTMAVTKYQGKTYRPNSEEESSAALAELREQPVLVTEVKESQQKSAPSPPFITSTLQQAASTQLGFSVKRTMTAAQKLYEAGHITYMRTDSFNLSSAAIAQCRKYLTAEFAKEYLPESPRYYKSKSKQAQEAHEAIRPTSASLSPAALPGTMGESERRLYNLIRNRFLACQMSDARFRRLKITATAGDYQLQASGRVLEFPGFLKVYAPNAKDDVILPAGIKEGQQLEPLKFMPQQHFTAPPPRYSEASLVKELEKLEIGRPSTYAPIISTIQERGYVRLQHKRFYAEKIAEIVTKRLDNSFTELLAYDFTASMEEQLDAIANGAESWTKVLDKFYQEFIERLEKADEGGGMSENFAVTTEIKCPTCARDMVIQNSATGIFLGCSGYNDKENPCKTTINLLSINEEINPDAAKPVQQRQKCPVCSSPMNDYVISATRSLHVCERNPDCSGILIEEGDFSDRIPAAEELECDRCGGIMTLKSGRFGKYFECENKESCGNKRRIMPNGEIAPTRMIPVETTIPCSKYKDSNYIIREGGLGLFLAAPGFPKQRETRSPYVRELIAYKDKLASKFHYLLAAPQEDEEGNLFQVRYSRKQAENYVMTVNEKNRPLQQAFYRNGKWELQAASKAATRTTRKVRRRKTA